MKTVTFQSVLFGVARLLGMNPNRDLNADRAATLCEYINRHVANAWTFDFWPEMLLTERRQFRPDYVAGNFITAGDEVYFPPSDTYYQALQLQISATEAPATLTGGEYVENSAWWAECATSYDAANWADATAYAVGDQVRNPADGVYYQCTAAHTAAGVLDAAKFGALAAFNKVLEYEQAGLTAIDAVKQISRRDPRVYPTNFWPVNFTKSAGGFQLYEDAPNQFWVQFRQAPPTFTTERWGQPDPGEGYDLGAHVYYQGDVYQSAFGNNESTVDGVTNWILVPFPAVLQDFVKRASQADALRDQKQTDRARAEMNRADEDLQDALDQELAGQGQYDSATVRVA